MAKSKTENTESAQPAAVASAEDLALVRQVIQDITGCGETESLARGTALDAAAIATIAEHERAGNRPLIPPLIS